MQSRSTGSLTASRLLLHLACVAALFWPAIVNRQPFFFPDTTAYVRAADLAVQIVSRGAITTAWSRSASVPAPAAPGAGTPGDAAPQPVARGSDGTGGNVMAGRSPYFGALLYVAYLASGFWLFVIAQAVVAYALIGLALRCFAIDRPRLRAAIALTLAVFSPLAFYDSLLLADALAGFGILAFLILASARSTLSRAEQAFLVIVLLLSVVSHLTHIVMLLGMTATLALGAALRWLGWRQVRWPVVLGLVGVAIGFASVTLTARVVQAALGKPPALVPLMTARFIADGPGRDYVVGGCDGGRFIACRLPFTGTSSTDYLWARELGTGVFLPASPDTRERLSAEDTAFARAVLLHYPLRQGGMMAWNTLLQIATFDSDLMNQSCFVRPGCNADALPPRVAATMRASLSGRDGWPLRLIRIKDYAGVAAALVALLLLWPRLHRDDRAAAARLLLWIGLFATAMLVNGFLGGAVSEPQGRYQARIVWILPLIALVGWARWKAVPRAPLPGTPASGYGG